MGLSNKGGGIMKSESVKVLGQYDFREGGSISIAMGPNMEFGTEVSTMIHEMQHMHLINTTAMGFVLNILEMERVHAQGKDSLQNECMKKLTTIISGIIIDVQEIYANNMELLTISDLGGKESARKFYEMKPQKYKEYCDTLSIIVENTELSLDKKKEWVNYLCTYAMNVDVNSEQFVSALYSDKKLKQYFDNENHPQQRLKEGIELYKNGQYAEIKESFRLDINDFLLKVKNCESLKYVNIIFEDWEEIFKDFIKGVDNIDSFNEMYEKSIEERIKLFDLSTLKVIRGPSISEQKSKCYFVIKNCANLDNQIENLYIVGHEVFNNEPTYIATEVSPLEFQELSKDKLCILLSFYEYDFMKCKPKYLETQGRPVIVVIDDYRECFKWIQEETKKGELYIGDLYDDTVHNFYTVLFFTKRSDPDTIFVFPTIKKLAKRIIDDLNIKDAVIYSKQEEFLKILACFDNEPKMLECLHWLLSFFTNSKGEFATLNDPATKLNYDLTRTLLDSVFKIKINNYFKYFAALPTQKTPGKPFYTLMEFNGNNNTGIIKAETDKLYPIFFNSVQQATYWKNKCTYFDKDIKKFQVVGVDIYYWKTLKEILSKTKMKVCVCINAELGMIIPMELDDIDKSVNFNS